MASIVGNRATISVKENSTVYNWTTIDVAFTLPGETEYFYFYIKY
ncbi:hypothetical protein [Spiroplasma taiwanense]|nr:hypothetical protein [Spiroplasma taiwanense]